MSRFVDTMTDEAIIAFVEKHLRLAATTTVLPERRPWELPDHSVAVRDVPKGREVFVSFSQAPYYGSVFMPPIVDDWDGKRTEFEALAQLMVNELANF